MSCHFEMQGNITVPEMLVEDIEYYLDHEFDITPEVTPVVSVRDEGQQKMCVISFDASSDWRFPDDVAQTLNQLTTTFGCYGEIKVESDDLDKRFFSIVAKEPGDKWEEKIGQVIYGDITENLTKEQMREIYWKVEADYILSDVKEMVSEVSEEYRLNERGCDFELPYSLLKEENYKEIAADFERYRDYTKAEYDVMRNCVKQYFEDTAVAREAFKNVKELRFALSASMEGVKEVYKPVVTVNKLNSYAEITERFVAEVDKLIYDAITDKDEPLQGKGRWDSLKLESIEFVPERELTLDEKLSQKAEMVNGESGRETKNRLKEER